MKKTVTAVFVLTTISACAHSGVSTKDVLNTRLGDFSNLEVVGCNMDMDNNRHTLRAVYLKGNTTSADCFSVHFSASGEVAELNTIPCGVLDDALMNDDCELTE